MLVSCVLLIVFVVVSVKTSSCIRGVRGRGLGALGMSTRVGELSVAG